MFTSILRVLAAFMLASLVAALVCIGFANPPAHLSSIGLGMPASELTGAIEYWLAVATHIAMFGAPFALIAAAFGEWLQLRGWLYYGLAGLAIAVMGFFALFNGESQGEASIWNSYAGMAFSAAGLAGGLTYWLAGGNRAGGPLEVLVPAAAAAEPVLKVDTGAESSGNTEGFVIERTGPGGKDARLVTSRKLERPDFFKVATALGQKPMPARKTGFAAARMATGSETIETLWNGKETTNTAKAGDWIVTNLNVDKKPILDGGGNANTYVVTPEKFSLLYEENEGENEFGRIYKPKSIVDVILFPGGFDIIAPWGERQKADAGYLVLNGRDVYGNNSETFDATYEIVK